MTVVAAQGPRPALPRRREHPASDRAARRARADDVVLEVGPGLGVLTRFLAERVAHVHAVEVDRRLEEHLAGIERTDVHWGDALRPRRRSARAAAAQARREPARTTSPRRSSPRASRSSSSSCWCVMVQREVADRFFARPSTKAYGAVSVLVQLATERTGLPSGLARGVPAAAERRLRARRVPAHRAGGDAEVTARRRRRVRAPAQDARELARARGASPPASARSRRSPRSAAGPTCARRRSSRRSSSRSRRRCGDRARSREDQPRARRRAAARRRQARARHRLPARRPRRPHHGRAGARDDGRGLPPTRSSGSALAALAAPHGWRVRIEKHMPVAAGLGGGSSDAATALRLANAQLAEPLAAAELHDARRARRRRRAVLPGDGPQLGTGDGTTLEPLDLPQDFVVLLAAAARRREGVHRATCTPPSTRATAPPASTSGRRRSATRSPRCGGRATSRRCRANDLASLAARRAAARLGRVPRGRERRRSGRLRALPRRRRRGARARARCARLGETWMTRTCVVRLKAMFGAHAIDQGSTRSGRWLRGTSPAHHALDRGVRGAAYLFHVLHWWEAVGLAVIAVGFWWYAAREQPLRRAAPGRLDLRGLAAARPLRAARARDREGGRDRRRRAARDRRAHLPLHRTSRATRLRSPRGA